MVELADVIGTWLDNHRILRDHFKVYKKSEWPHDNGEPDRPHLAWPFEEDAIIHMACSNIVTVQNHGYMHLCLSIEKDHVYYTYPMGNSTDTPSRESNFGEFKILAATSDFFNRIESDLIEVHWNSFRYELCNVEKETATV